MRPSSGSRPRNAPMLGLAYAIAFGGWGGSALAADAETAVATQLRRLMERVEQLEQRNQALEKKLLELSRGASGAAPSTRTGALGQAAVTAGQPAADARIEQRLEALEQAQAKAEEALGTERISANEPELVTRLKALEVRSSSMQKQAREIEALEGITVSANLVSVAQRVSARGSASGEAESRLSYRGDISVTLPGGKWGDAEGSVYTQVRLGQGDGIGLRPTYTSTANTTSFRVAGVTDPDSSFAILAQAWYQLDVPLPIGGFKPLSRQRLVLNAGKIDPFVFFDQNAVADDETRQFLNNVFVHNPLLDSGGDVGADIYGFSPGARLAYVDETDKAHIWGASLGVFGSGPATDFSGSPGRPFLIGQVNTATRMINGLPGNYRLYAWHNGRAIDFDGSVATHAGWGASIDQRFDDEITLFGRYGQRVSGHGSFDRALTLGAQIGGSAWRRAADTVGFALAFLHTSNAYRQATADGSLVGYAASGVERIAELYYNMRLNDRVEITPDLQWIQRAGGRAGASAGTIVGLRVRFGF